MKYKNINKKWFLVIAIISLLLLSGCTGKDTGQTTGTDDKQKQSPTGSSGDRPAPGTVKAVHFSKLTELLPGAPAGWTAEEPKGYSYEIPEGGSWSTAIKTFKKGDEGRAEVSIMDSAYYNVGLFGAWNSFVQMETSDGYYKTTKVKGYSAFETYSKASKQYGLFVNVKDRFMVNINVNNDDKDALNSISDSINYDSIAALS